MPHLTYMDLIFKALQEKGTNCHIIVYDNQILFYPVLPCIVDALTITEKKMELSERTKFMRDIVYDRLPMYATFQRSGGIVGVTYRGFTNRIIKALMDFGYTFSIDDQRISDEKKGGFPEPQLKNMFGFRFSQQALLEKALLKKQSGMIGAPTRWGKTTLIVNILRAYPNLVTTVIAPGVDLVTQLYHDITDKDRGIKNREVKLICTGSRTKYPSDTGITVCSVDSLDKIDYGATELVICDEPHALVTSTRLALLDKFPKARMIAVGATLTGRFDGRDALIEGIFGPVLANRTYKEAVAEGAICPIKAIMLDIEMKPGAGGSYMTRDAAYNQFLFKNESIANLIKRICEEVIPQDWQTLIFIKHEAQAELCLKAIGEEHTIAMAKRMSKSVRDETTDLLRKNVIKRCLCTKIYVQGVTFSDIRVLINAEAGGNNTGAIQKPGRLAEIRPNKKCGILIDLFFKPAATCTYESSKGESWMPLCSDSKNREKAYREKGYDIYHVNSVETLKELFNTLA